MTDKEKLVELIINTPCVAVSSRTAAGHIADNLITNGVTVLPESGIGDMSDGYHTFNELYHLRAVLFSVICNLHPLCSWKAKKHHDGTMYDGMFIVGINTSEGQATYHYDIDPYWDMFKVPEAEFAPEWDGHTADEAIRRLSLLGRDCLEENQATSDKTSEWISASQSPKEYRDEYGELIPFLVCEFGTEYPYRAMYDGKNWGDGISKIPVTYWMPLPEAPKDIARGGINDV